MQFIPGKIVKMIEKNNITEKSKSIVIINGFERLDIYADVADEISKFAKKNHLDVTIKLAKRKWDKLSKIGDSAVAQRMEQNDWVATKESVTYYRNCHNTNPEANLLVLMGTEEEEDTGGLRNCFTIRPQFIVDDIRKNYYSVLESCFDAAAGKDCKDCVNMAFKLLFDCVTIDICQLNDIVDEWEGRFSSPAEFLQVFGESLHEWGLPDRIIKPLTAKDLNAKESPLRLEHNFISGKVYQKINKKAYATLEAKLKTYAGEGKYADSDVNWTVYGFNDFQDFANTLLEFARSENVNKNRERLMPVDFTIINDILKFKSAAKKKPKASSEISIYGEPMDVFIRAILKVLKKCKAEKIEQDIREIHFEFKDGQVNTGYMSNDDDEKKELLADAWRNICFHVNGIFDFLNSSADGFLGGKSKLVCDSPDFFTPSCVEKMIDSGLITVVSEKNHLDKISFSVCLADSDGNVLCKDDEDNEPISYSFKWGFDSEAPWLFDFSSLVNEESLAASDAAVIPIGVFSSIQKTLFIKSQEEFFDLFADDSIDLSFDLCRFVRDEAEKFAEPELSAFCDKFDALGKVFCCFVSELASSGFYHVLCGTLLTELNAAYMELIDSVLSFKFDEDKQWVLDAVLQAFTILDHSSYIAKDEDLEYVIVPPWHPAALQKLQAQKHFLLDGVNDYFHDDTEDGKLLYPVEKDFDYLLGLAEIPSFVDVFPADGTNYIGIYNTFGHYCIYANEENVKEKSKIRMKDVLRKEAIYDDDFNDKFLTQMNDNAQMIYDILKNYTKAMPSNRFTLRLVFINPVDLQPIISAVYKYAEEIHGDDPESFIDLKLTILTRSDNKGGRNCLSYWMNHYFPEEQNTKIHIYLNEWSSNKELNALTENNDIVFIMNVLHNETFKFVSNPDSSCNAGTGCLFPILYKPSPVSKTTMKRKIEITQPQFDASFKLTQVARYKVYNSDIPKESFLVVRETNIVDQTKGSIDILHKKAYWVVCIDRVMDGALLRQGKSSKEYSIIGFSTGKGLNGQYNVTITTRNSILEVVKKKLQKRLARLFKWPTDVLSEVSDRVMDVARSLDGISVFSAINQNGNNINEFMAYVMTSIREAQFETDSALKVIIHLDSYRHWFDNSTKINESSSRPDFLMLSASPSDSTLKLKATVIECKTAGLNNYDVHVDKAKEQIRHGLFQLQRIFDPASKAIDRRFWFAQLYRALVFAQVTFSDSSDDFKGLTDKLRAMLDGIFEIEWEGKIIGYWLDMQGDKEEQDTKDGITICNVPQELIKKLLTNDKISSYSFIEPQIVREMSDMDEEDESFIPEADSEPAPVKDAKDNALPDLPEEKKPAENPLPPSEELSSVGPASVPSEDEKSKLSDIRVLIGKDRFENPVYWEFGNEMLANRHLLITGTSGQGKTYAIQAMMHEALKHGISIVVFDYTSGFSSKQLEPKFLSKLEGRIDQKFVYSEGVPISPFVQHELQVSDRKELEKPANVATRIAATFSHQYKFGDQQRSAIYQACTSGITKYKEDMSMSHLRGELSGIGTKFADSVISRLLPFFDMVEFHNNRNYDWGSILYNDLGRLTIFQLANIERDMQVVITEFMLWDLWNYAVIKDGNKDKPFIVVLDEAQNLSHSETSPSGKILTEGRKFGWSAWYATQSLSTLGSDEVSRLQNSSLKMYFKPIETDIKDMSRYIDSTNPNDYIDRLSNLKKGECIVVGDRIQKDGKFGKGRPTVTKVVSFDER